MVGILVTGGAGFIGTTLCQHLHDNGHDVTSLDLVEPAGKPWTEIQEDIRNDFEIEGIGVIVHLAAQISVPKSIINPDETLSINSGIFPSSFLNEKIIDRSFILVLYFIHICASSK